jgi:DNA-binding NarL/FixJ family response regulator
MRKCIMIVEDYEDTRAILRALLTYHNYRVVEHATAEAMFEQLDEVNPDAIILDLRLPGMDGCEALRQLRASGFRKPVFLFSEYFDLHLSALRRCQPDGFYSKSSGPLPLFEAIRKSVPQNRFEGPHPI